MLTFNAETHEYTLDGKAIPSVTEIIKPIGWNIQNTQPWDNRYKERGTAVHEAAMMLDYGEAVEVDAEIAGYLTAYTRFLKDYSPQWEYIELMGHCPECYHGIAFGGTIDRVGYIDGKPCILDIKTGQLHDALISAQLEAYADIYCELAEVDDWWIENYRLYGLKLSKDGTYKLKDYTMGGGDLLEAAITIYKATKGRKR